MPNTIPSCLQRLFASPGKLDGIRRTLKDFGYVEDEREAKLWETRKLKDANEDAWRRDHEDVELYPIPGR